MMNVHDLYAMYRLGFEKQGIQCDTWEELEQETQQAWVNVANDLSQTIKVSNSALNSEFCESAKLPDNLDTCEDTFYRDAVKVEHFKTPPEDAGPGDSYPMVSITTSVTAEMRIPYAVIKDYKKDAKGWMDDTPKELSEMVLDRFAIDLLHEVRPVLELRCQQAIEEVNAHPQ